jgi:hypothetical protein
MLMHFVSSLGSSRSSEKRLTTNSLDIITYVIELINNDLSAAWNSSHSHQMILANTC